MRKLLLLLLSFYSVITTAQQLGFSLADDATKVQIPIEVHSNLVVVPVIINNQMPLKFIVDTGVRTTILCEKVISDALNLKYSKTYSMNAPGMEKTINAYVTNNVSIDIPGVNGRGLTMLVLEDDYLELKHSLGVPIHGILGYEFFSRFVVKIDYTEKIMTLMVPQKFRSPRRFAKLPMVINDTKPYINTIIKFNDTTSINAELLVDTGASHSLFLDERSDKKITVPPRYILSTIGRGLGGVITGKTGRIKSLKIGKYTLSGVITNFPDANTYKITTDTLHEKGKRIVYRNGSLGGDALSRFKVIFDFPEERLYLKRNRSFRKKSFNNMAGIIVRAESKDLNQFEIVEVRKNSAAYHADVHEGDKIISVNNLPTEKMNLTQLNNFFTSKPGKKITLKLKRGEGLIEKQFRLVDEI